MTNYDVVVIGAGVVGGLCARELTRYDLKVCILEKENDVAMGATRANSAIVHAGFDAKVGSLKARFNVQGSEMMEDVARELGVKYRRNGSLVIGFNDEDKAALNELLERGNKNGVRDLELIDGDRARELEPRLEDTVTCALNAPTGGIICPYELCIASVGNAMDNGAELLTNFEVVCIERDEGDTGFTVKSRDGKEVFASYVVNAAGLYSDSVAEMAGVRDFTVHPRRGEYLLLDREAGGIVDRTIFRTPSKMGKGILITPTVDGNVLIGPTSVDTEDKSDRSTTSEGLNSVMSQVSEEIKGMSFNKTITSFCGLRAVGSVGDFIINNPRKGFINAAGIESPGLTASPAIAKYIVELLEHDGLTLTENKSFVPTRKRDSWFSELDPDSMNEVIREHPEYGHIVCRCEGISEGEIIEAIRKNPPATDIDGVKRRTRSGMGRCQGGFCMPYVADIIARERNTDFADVTKFGGSSYLNMYKRGERK